MAEKNKILNGSENVLWDLSELFSSHDDPLIPQHLEKCKNVSKLFQDKYKNRVVDLIDSELEMAYREMINFFSKMVQISQFANLLLSSKTSDNNAKQLVSRVEEAFSAVSNNTVFFDLELAKKSLIKFKSKKNKEHVTYAMRNMKMSKILNVKSYNLSIKKDLNQNRLTLDNSNDYKIIRRVVKKITIRDSWKKIYLRYKNL